MLNEGESLIVQAFVRAMLTEVHEARANLDVRSGELAMALISIRSLESELEKYRFYFDRDHLRIDLLEVALDNVIRANGYPICLARAIEDARETKAQSHTISKRMPEVKP